MTVNIGDRVLRSMPETVRGSEHSAWAAPLAWLANVGPSVLLFLFSRLSRVFCLRTGDKSAVSQADLSEFTDESGKVPLSRYCDSYKYASPNLVSISLNP